MKKIKCTSKKFNLEKFEVAKLKSLKLIKGGQGEGPETGGVLTTTGGIDQDSSVRCLK